MLQGNYSGAEFDAYVKNYSHRSGQLPLKRDARVVLNSGNHELSGDSRLQVAPNSKNYIRPENLIASKTPVPYDKRGIAPSGNLGMNYSRNVLVRDDALANSGTSNVVRQIREANKDRLSKLG